MFPKQANTQFWFCFNSNVTLKLNHAVFDYDFKFNGPFCS